MKVGEHKKEERKPKGCACERPVALMVTHERPGFLLATVGSFWRSAPHLHLYVFDDGSTSPDKEDELELVRETGAEIIRLPHMGFAETWLQAFHFAKRNLIAYDSLVLLEDDIIFAEGWLDVLSRMQRGIHDMGFEQGFTSCLRPHLNPQSRVVELDGIRAYQSMAHTWHVNMLPFEVLERMDVIEESVDEVRKSTMGRGLDVYLVGNLAHRLKRLSFVSMESWVGHMGFAHSLVASQGFENCKHPGVNLVGELDSLAKGFERQWRSI